MKKFNPDVGKNTQFPLQDPTKGGRPRKLVGQTVADLKDAGVTAVSKSEIETLYLTLINTTEEELKELLEDKNQPMLVRIVIKNVFAEKGFEIIEKMMDRTLGKPIQTNENINTDVNKPSVAINFIKTTNEHTP